MIKSIRIKDFTYKGKKYKFKESLKCRVESYLLNDGKTFGWELCIEAIPDGFTRYEPIEDIEKEVKKFIKEVFDNYLTKDDKELSSDDRMYKKMWIDQIQPPKKK